MRYTTFEVAELEENDIENLNKFIPVLSSLTEWTKDSIWEATKAFCKENKLDTKNFSQLIRAVLTSRRYGIGLQDIMILMGFETIKHRFIMLTDEHLKREINTKLSVENSHTLNDKELAWFAGFSAALGVEKIRNENIDEGQSITDKDR